MLYMYNNFYKIRNVFYVYMIYKDNKIYEVSLKQRKVWGKNNINNSKKKKTQMTFCIISNKSNP